MNTSEDLLIVQNNQNLTEELNKNSKKQKKKKIPITIHLTEEAEHAFIELYIHRLRKDRKNDKSAIACQAIIELYEKECKNIQT